MKKRKPAWLVGVAFAILLHSCTIVNFQKKSPHEQYAEQLLNAGLNHSALGERWLQQAELSLHNPVQVKLPYSETGYFSAERVRAIAFRFSAQRGEQIVWQPCNVKVFWGEIAPCNHVLQIYENDEEFLDSLEVFVSSGIEKGDCVITIATLPHLSALRKRLLASKFDVDALIAADQFIPLDAEETLSKFMVTGWPDQKLFIKVVSDLIARARKHDREVRAFGEMVAILWAQGYSGATVQLEYIWNKFSETEAFCLFCAYPKSGFTDEPGTSLLHICAAHSKMIEGTVNSRSEIFYKNIA